MYRCDFSFAHIQFQFESEFEIRVGKELLPFLIEGNKKIEFQFVIVEIRIQTSPTIYFTFYITKGVTYEL